MDTISEWIPGKVLTNEGIFTEGKEKYILNQVQLYGNRPDNPLSQAVFKKFSYANIYSKLHDESALQYNSSVGDIAIMGDGSEKKRFIINMFSQHHYDRPQFLNDGYDLRYRYFISCMNKVYKIPNLESVAIPEALCTGTARYITTAQFFGRNWDRYLDVINKFASKYPTVKTVLYVGDYLEKIQERMQAKRSFNRQVKLSIKKSEKILKDAPPSDIDPTIKI